MQLLGKAQASRILLVAAVDHVGERLHALVRLVVEPDRAPGFAIDHGHLLAPAQILNRVGALCCGHAKSNAAAIAATVEPEHEARLFRRAAMREGIDAE